MCVKQKDRDTERNGRRIAEAVQQWEMISVYTVYLHVKGGLQIFLWLLCMCLLVYMCASCDNLAVWDANLH